jgi:hypothetical protein
MLLVMDWASPGAIWFQLAVALKYRVSHSWSVQAKA